MLPATYTHVLDMEVSDNEVCMVDGIDQRDAEAGVLGGAQVGPVLGTLDLHLLHQVGQHHHRGDVVVPDHAPEVADGVREWTLSGNVLFLTIVSLTRERERERERERSMIWSEVYWPVDSH